MDIKVVSLNTWHGGRLFDPMVVFLRDQNADIVLLQEVMNAGNPALEPRFNCYTELPKRLGYQYAAFAPAFTCLLPEGHIIEGNAILSKFPLETFEPIFFDEPYRDDYTDTPENFSICPRNLQHAEAATPVGPVHVFNLQGVWDLDGDSASPKRMHMSRAVIEQTKGLPRVILAGDTNAKPTNKAMTALENHLVSVFKNERTTSFNVWRKDLVAFLGYATAVVDLMYVSPDVQVLAHDCPAVDISDHLPLTATLHLS